MRTDNETTFDVFAEDGLPAVAISQTDLRHTIHELHAALNPTVVYHADPVEALRAAYAARENHIRRALVLLPGWLLEEMP